MKLLLVMLGLTMGIIGYSQGTGIAFVKEDITKAKAQATADSKIIFVDAYTTWCGPCKMMDRTTFKDEGVASYYNDNFINLKLDMEKGIGPSFAQKHSIRGYPSFLFLDAEGDLIHRSLGFQNSDRFLELGKSALNPNKQVVTLQNKFEAGERDQAFLLNYADALTMAGMDGYESATKAYLEQEENWNTDENIKVIFDYSRASMDSELFNYTLENKEKFEKVVGQEKVTLKIDYAAATDVQKNKVDVSDKDALSKHFAKYYGAGQAKEEATEYYLQNLMYAPGKINEQKYLSEIQLFMATNPNLSSQSLNSHAWRIYELSDDKLLLSQAESWINRSIDLEENSYNLDTKAAIQYKLGKKSEAKQSAEASIKMAIEEGNDPSTTQELLEKIKAL